MATIVWSHWLNKNVRSNWITDLDGSQRLRVIVIWKTTGIESLTQDEKQEAMGHWVNMKGSRNESMTHGERHDPEIEALTLDVQKVKGQ